MGALPASRLYFLCHLLLLVVFCPSSLCQPPSISPSTCFSILPPAPGITCGGTHWVTVGNFSGAGNISLTLPMVINGSLSMAPNSTVSVVYSGQPTVYVSGIASFTGSSLVVNLSNSTSAGRIIIGYAANVSGLFQSVQISQPPSSPDHLCSAAQSDYQPADRSIGVVLSDCSTHSSSIWIASIVICTIIVLIVVVVILLGLYLLRNRKMRNLWREDMSGEEKEELTTVSFAAIKE